MPNACDESQQLLMRTAFGVLIRAHIHRHHRAYFNFVVLLKSGLSIESTEMQPMELKYIAGKNSTRRILNRFIDHKSVSIYRIRSKLD